MIADPVVVHVDDNGNAEQMELVVPEDIEPAQGRTEEELLEERKAASDVEDSDKAADTDNENKTEGDKADIVEQDVNDESSTGTTADNANSSTAENGKTVDEDEAGHHNSVNQSSDTDVEVSNELDESQSSDTDAVASDDSDQNAKSGSTVEFETDSFSVYAIVYTVDFYYEINGKMYEFSIPGGGFVSLEHLVEVLGIASADENTENGSENAENSSENSNDFVGEVPVVDENVENSTACEEAIKLNEVEVSEATKKFVADVESVEFSNPELVWVGKVEEDATVSVLKEAYGLEVEYSAELTDEQIADINAQTVEAGDWALISIHPFTSEESLTVTMKNGDAFVIGVTDAQQITKIDENFDGETKIVIWATGSDNNNYALYYNNNTHQVETKPIDPANIDSLDSGYQWTIKIQQGGDRYYIRPAVDPTKTLALPQLNPNSATTDLVNGNENIIYLYPPYTRHKSQFNDYYFSNNQGWILEGWGWTRLNLGYYSHEFEGHSWYCSDDIHLTKVDVTIDNIDTSEPKIDKSLHYIITDHYIDEDNASTSIVRFNDYLDEGQFIDIYNNASSSQLYAGITITAGNEAVEIISDDTGEIRITNSDDSNDIIHLVHVDYYYKKKRPAIQAYHFNENDKYDTKEINGDISYELGQERLHTEKTASVIEDGDGRSFNLTLEAWNVDWNIATIGMVLDASGSMAWDGAPGHYMQVNSDGKYIPYKFLSQAEVNKILYTDYSDYSVAGYGDYTYFVYEPGKSVNEYAPLGYYNGTSTVSSESLTYISLDGTLDTAYATQTGVPSGRAGWYYVNTGNARAFKAIGGSKEFNGISPNHSNIANLTLSVSTNNGNKYITFSPAKDGNNSVYQNNMKEWFVDNDTTGRYRKTNTYGVTQGTPAQFFVDDDGYLHCFFFHSDMVFESYVFAKQDNEPIKTEMLQDAIGSFVSTMDSVAPDSAFGMTRFSRSNTTNSNGFIDNQLPLLNWTTDSESIIGSLNMAYGGEYKANSYQTDKGYENAGSLTVYDYGLTSNTSTQSGLTSFNTYLASNNAALNKWAEENAKPVNGGYEYDKYVIVFTDGKDTDLSNASNRDRAKNAADNLKTKGYSVITVLLAPDSAFNSNGSLNQEFTDAKNFLDTLNGPRNGGGNELNWTQETFIATAADKKALRTIFKDIANKIAKSMTDMTVRDYIDPRFQLVDENDEALELGYHPELGFTLYYDAERDMQYVEWTGQTIPTNNVMDNTAVDENGTPAEISLWSQTIRVRAKEDFLGGNEVLSNANVEKLNKVYPDGQPNNTNSKTSRTFPRTTVDPRLLTLELGTTEDTVFLGETIDAAEHSKLENAIGDTVDSSWYYEYLERYGVVTNTDYITQLKQGTKVEIPYYYFPDDTTRAVFNAAQLNPNNKDAYMKDCLGTLSYEWVPCDESGNEINLTDPYNHLTTNTDDIHYRLKIKYTPYSENDRDAFVNSMTDPDDHSRPIKDPVGTEQTVLESEKDEGIATVHVVSGQLTVSKQVKKDDILKYLNKNGQAVFTFNLTKTGNLSSVYPSLGTDYTSGHGGYIYPATISVTVTEDLVNAATVTDGYVMITGTTVEKLPIGTYEIEENPPEDPRFEFEAIGHLAVDANYRADVGDASEKVTFEIGQLASDADVTTPVSSTKPYLNAQMVSVYARNTVYLSVPVSIKKVDVGNTSSLLGNAVFSLFDSDAVDNSGNLKQDAVAIKTGITTDADDDLGFADLDELDIGTYYLVETAAPAGYLLPEYQYIKITVDTEEVKYQAGTNGEPRTAETITRNEQEVYLLEVYNFAGVELPAAGGSGTTLIYLLGIILTSLAGIGLMMKRKSRNTA